MLHKKSHATKFLHCITFCPFYRGHPLVFLILTRRMQLSNGIIWAQALYTCNIIACTLWVIWLHLTHMSWCLLADNKHTKIKIMHSDSDVATWGIYWKRFISRRPLKSKYGSIFIRAEFGIIFALGPISLVTVLNYSIIYWHDYQWCHSDIIKSHQLEVSSGGLPAPEELVGLQGQSAGYVTVSLHGGVYLPRVGPCLLEVCLQVSMVTAAVLVCLLQLQVRKEGRWVEPLIMDTLNRGQL